MVDYVVGFLKTPDGVILVQKNKPLWQQGLLNGIGGKIEEGETPLQAMVREWREEIGWSHDKWELFCTIDCANDVTVYFFKDEVTDMVEDAPFENDIGEVIYYYNPDPFSQNFAELTNVIPNLNWLLPMAFFDNDKPTAKVKLNY